MFTTRANRKGNVAGHTGQTMFARADWNIDQRGVSVGGGGK